MSEQVILAFETSGAAGGAAAVMTDGTIIKEIILGEATRGGEGLMPAAKDCLEAAGLSPKELFGVAVDIGPGSFTGLRVGVMSAKAFAFAAELPVWGVGSLDAAAMEFGNTSQYVYLCQNARRDEVYCALYKCEGGGIPARQGEVSALSPAEATAKLKNFEHEVTLAGSGIEQMRSQNLLEGLSHINIVTEEICPKPSAIGLIAIEESKEKPSGDDLHALQPVYPRRKNVTMPVLGEPVDKPENAK